MGQVLTLTIMDPTAKTGYVTVVQELAVPAMIAAKNMLEEGAVIVRDNITTHYPPHMIAKVVITDGKKA